jgi:hypothetical protein
LRPNPVVPTEKNPPPTPPCDAGGGGGIPDGDTALLAACRVDDLASLAERCQQARRDLGRPTVRWSAPRLLEVLRQAVAVRGWPAAAAAPALLALAADPATRGPMRLACPGPWWDAVDRPPTAPAQRDPVTRELDELEARLLEADGRRIWAQQRTRPAGS